MECVSCVEGRPVLKYRSGDPDQGSTGATYLNRYQARTIADDGTAFFTSTGDLVPEDVNGRRDVYARDLDGGLRLISSGRPGASARFLDATSDAASAFIATDERFVASDTDRQVDIYRVAEGIGFPEEPVVAAPPCGGSDCRAPVAAPPVLAAIGSVGFVGGGNAPVRAGASVRVSRLRAVTGSAGALTVRVPDAGRISVAGASIRRASKPAAKGAATG